MFAKLKAAWSRFTNKPAGASDAAGESDVEYKGYRIRPAPYRTGGEFQTAGVIRKDAPGDERKHEFIERRDADRVTTRSEHN